MTVKLRLKNVFQNLIYLYLSKITIYHSNLLVNTEKYFTGKPVKMS